MFSFVTLGTNDLKKSKSFYDELLASIDIVNVVEENTYVGYAIKNNLNNILNYKDVGVDGISIGALTHQAQSKNIKLELKHND